MNNTTINGSGIAAASAGGGVGGGGGGQLKKVTGTRKSKIDHQSYSMVLIFFSCFIFYFCDILLYACFCCCCLCVCLFVCLYDDNEQHEEVSVNFVLSLNLSIYSF